MAQTVGVVFGLSILFTIIDAAAIEKLGSSRNQSVEYRKHRTSTPQFPVIASAHVSNQRYNENVAKNCSKLLQIRRQ